MSGANARDHKEGQLLTERLRVRPLRERDLPRLALVAPGDAGWHSLTVPLVPPARGDVGEAFLVESRNDRTILGAAGYRASAGRAMTVELALWIRERVWGQGYGTEVAHAVIDHAFGDPSVTEVFGVLRVTNERGRRLIEKCGFQLRGAGMARSASGAFPVERFSLGRRTWLSLKAWGARPPGADGDEQRRASA
jgi:RimJ/RimL family protein N-acetyltransferase